MTKPQECSRLTKLLRSIFPIERVAGSALILVVILYSYFGLTARLLSTQRSFISLYGAALLSIAHLYFLSLLVAYITTIILHREMEEQVVWRRFCTTYISKRSVVETLRCFHAVALVLLCFAHLKHLIPYVNAAVWDKPLLILDQMIMGSGLFPALIPDGIAEALTQLLSVSYQTFYFYMSFVICLFLVQPNTSLRQEFALSYGLLWMLAIPLIYALPTWGPCFYAPHLFENIPPSAMTEIQHALWTSKERLVSHPLNSNYIYAISGFPSLHLGLLLLGSCYLRSFQTLLFSLSVVILSLTFLATLYFGWHYLADDLAAVPYCMVVVLAAKRVTSAWLALGSDGPAPGQSKR